MDQLCDVIMQHWTGMADFIVMLLCGLSSSWFFIFDQLIPVALYASEALQTSVARWSRLTLILIVFLTETSPSSIF
jgi:hypothetical protein